MEITTTPVFIVEDALEDGRLKAALADYDPEPLGLSIRRAPVSALQASESKSADGLSEGCV